MPEAFGVADPPPFPAESKDETKVGLVGCATVLFASGIGTGVLVLPYAMRAVGYQVMLALMFAGAMLSGITTTALFLATNRRYRPAFSTADNRPEQPLVEVPTVSSGSSLGLPGSPNGADIARKISKDVAKVGMIGTNSIHPEQQLSDGADISYAKLLVQATRPQMAFALDFVMFTSCFGATVSYFIFIAGFLRTFPGWPLSAPTTIVLLGAVLYPLGVPKTVGVISRLGNLSLAAMIALASGIVYRAGSLAPERESPIHAVAPDWIANAPQVVCINLFAFSWHINAVPTAAALYQPTTARCFSVAFGAATAVMVVYSIIAYSAYVSFGDATLDNIVVMYPIDDPVFIVIRCFLVGSVSSALVAHLFPARNTLLSLFSLPPTFFYRVTITGLYVALCTFSAILFPEVKDLIGFCGGIFATLLCILFPTIIARLVAPKVVFRISMVVVLPFCCFLFAAAVGLI
jgi:amino acid permease